jgi:hypothetical protein
MDTSMDTIIAIVCSNFIYWLQFYAQTLPTLLAKKFHVNFIVLFRIYVPLSWWSRVFTSPFLLADFQYLRDSVLKFSI